MESLSLLELNELVKQTLDSHMEPSYWVVAEIGEMRVNQKGHCYLELIQTDNDKVVAKARATIWSYTYRNLSTWFQGITGQPLAEGIKILANVKVGFHELYGFSLNIRDIDATYTLGEKERLRQEVINRLTKEGVIDMNKSLTLPLVPQRIAVISSPTAAGYGDFMQHLESNPYGYHIEARLFEALMQGKEAPASIIQAMHRIHQQGGYDLVALIRGGGSQLDLECFDDYDLCNHLAQFPLPVITGIGHERDDTIADMVAHTKLKTPTAVAEFIIQGIAAFQVAINEEAMKIARTVREQLHRARLDIQLLHSSISHAARNTVRQHHHRLQHLVTNLRHLSRQQITRQQHLLQQLDEQHRHLDPNLILQRGYTFTMIDGQPLKKISPQSGAKLTTFTIDKIIESTVTSARKK